MRRVVERSCSVRSPVVVVLLVVLSLVGAAAPVRAAIGSGAGIGPGPAGAGQWIVVSATSHQSTYASLTAYRRSGGRWVRVAGPWRARVGYNGIARPGAKREGDGRTPAGTYALGFFFGVLADPGVAFPYRRARSYDVWDDDPASPRYNEWVDKRRHDPGRSPEPMHQVPVYDYAAVIRYNVARVPGRGSAIFLHVGTGTATAGCVSLPRHELVAILRWLRPRQSPRITIRVRAG
jgi:L,D-peptidoglycan transpeptidase YkuD (ErfK/YbiS/YcfS/YnhG family)